MYPGNNGRPIPTTSWEALWYGIASWLGVDTGSMSTVLPNAANFPDSHMITAEKLFVV